MSKETNLELKGLYEKVTDNRYSLFEEMSGKYQGRFRKALVIALPIWAVITAALIITTIFTEKYPVIAVPVYGLVMVFVFIFVISSTSIKINNVKKLLASENSELLIEIVQSGRKDSIKAFAIFALIDLGEKRIEEIIIQEKTESYYFRFEDDFPYAKEVYAIKRGYKSFEEFLSKK